jgi:hypothetical protein
MNEKFVHQVGNNKKVSKLGSYKDIEVEVKI